MADVLTINIIDKPLDAINWLIDNFKSVKVWREGPDLSKIKVPLTELHEMKAGFERVEQQMPGALGDFHGLYVEFKHYHEFLWMQMHFTHAS